MSDRALLCEASAPKVRLAPTIAPASAWSWSVRAANTSPVSWTSVRSDCSWRRSVPSTSLASEANGPRLPKASFRSRPRPLTASAEFCIQDWNASRVCWSNPWKISSIWVWFWTWVWARWPPSGIGCGASPPEIWPTSIVLGLGRGRSCCPAGRAGPGCRWSARRRSRRAASSSAGSPCASEEIGAYCGSISIVARVVLQVVGSFWHSLSGARLMSLTLPTETPPIRTSASFESVIASGKSAVNR